MRSELAPCVKFCGVCSGSGATGCTAGSGAGFSGSKLGASQLGGGFKVRRCCGDMKVEFAMCGSTTIRFTITVYWLTACISQRTSRLTASISITYRHPSRLNTVRDFVRGLQEQSVCKQRSPSLHRRFPHGGPAEKVLRAQGAAKG